MQRSNKSPVAPPANDAAIDPDAPRRVRLSAALAADVSSGWLLVALTIVYTFVITPSVVRALGSEQYGTWSFLNGLLAYSDLLYLGLGSALIKRVAEHVAAADQRAINRLASVVLTIYASLGTLCLVLFVSLAAFVPTILFRNSSPISDAVLTSVCLLQGLRVLFVFIGSAFGGIIFGHNRLARANLIKTLFAGLRFALIPVGIRASYPIVGLAAVMTLTTAGEAAALAIAAHRLNRRLRLRLTKPLRAELRFLYGFGVPSFGLLISNKLISYSDTTVIGFFRGATGVALYSFPLQLLDYARFVSGGLVNALLPRLAAMHQAGDMIALRNAYINANKVTCFLTSIAAVLVVALGPAFLSIWVGPAYGSQSGPILLFLGAAAVCQSVSTQAGAPFYQAMWALRVPSALLMAEGCANLILSIVLVQRYGLPGVALGTLLPTIVNAYLLPNYLCRRLGISVWALYRSSFGPALLLSACGAAVFSVLPSSAFPATYGGIFLRGCLLPPIAALVSVICFAPEIRAISSQAIEYVRQRFFGPVVIAKH